MHSWIHMKTAKVQGVLEVRILFEIAFPDLSEGSWETIS